LRRAYALLILASATACSNAEQPEPLRLKVSGQLENSKIREASGLARSLRQANLLWIINDHGAGEIVHAIDHKGSRIGEFELKKSKNKDWEDLASFEVDGKSYLMVAEIGDNDAKRKKRKLYFVEEPEPEKKAKAKLAWEVSFKYPDGPRDAESAAIDIENQRVLVLSKRDLPPQLYAIPIRTEADDVVTAEKLGAITSLHKPTRQELEYAPKTKDWYWRPVGMDISKDNLAAVILTYRTVYYFERDHEQSWVEALNAEPIRISLGNFKNAEAIAFGDDGRTIFVTGENKHSRLLRIDLNRASHYRE
jgi:hypothetical protein